MTAPGPWSLFWATPLRMRLYLTVVTVAAVALPLLLHLGPDSPVADWITAGALILVSVANVEIARALTGGLSRTHQPHKALSAWAFATGLLLSTPWLLVVVPVTYLHTRWRGLRLPLWKWVGSAVYLIVAGVAAAAVRHAILGSEYNFMKGQGGLGLVAMLAAAGTFLVAETLLFSGSALLNQAEDEVWLRATLTSWSFYRTEASVLVLGGLVAAVWTGGPWFTLIFLPIYLLAQRAALLEPLRERAEAAAALAATNQELEEANQFKIDLLGMLGHEIGNPLTAVQGYVEVAGQALEDGEPDEASDALAVIQRNAARMSRVVHEILGLVGSGRDTLHAVPEPCPVAPHLEAAVVTVSPGRRPVVECPPELVVSVQPGHLDQILANLLSNAEKYAGGATRLQARRNAGLVHLAVVDAGPGVHPGFRAHLFDRFARHGESAGSVFGTGLGLFISRELARANGGDIEHHDTEPHGSTFVITLPAAD